MVVRPAASSELVRRQMSRQPSTSTTPELALRRALHNLGLRFRVNQRVETCRPDVVFSRARIAVFVMGDFWHSCPVHGTTPKANAAWWAAKLAANTDRDRRQRLELESAGWLVVWVWECEDPVTAAAALREQWRLRTGRSARAVGDQVIAE
jgi:DNA mismatch endonuclease (patch repair protein)